MTTTVAEARVRAAETLTNPLPKNEADLVPVDPGDPTTHKGGLL